MITAGNSAPGPTPRTGWVLLTHVVSAGVMLGLLPWAEESPRPAIYGLFVSYFYRLATLAVLLPLHDAGGFGKRLVRSLSRPPHPERPSYQVTVGEGARAVPGRFGAYLFVLAVLAFFSVIEINVAKQEFATPMRVFGHELRQGLWLGLVWWVLDLFDRRITLRFDQGVALNLGYNSAEITVLALTVLTGGVASAMMETPWPYFIALLAWKTLYDVLDERKYPRGEHPAA
ncbi:MAG: hypothetical protein AB1452_10675 [Pseudomonadota bacterium]